jgi:peptidoglycan hydrolase CwlO-like protein
MAARPRPVRALVVVLAGVLMASVTTVSAAHADPVYPSWDDVQAARVSEAATKGQIERIQGFLDDLESKAIALSVDALQKGERYNIARDALDSAARESATLESQADAAKQTAAESAARAGHLVAQLVRTGGGSITMQLLVDGAGADDLLSKLGTMTKLTEQSAEVLTRAQTDENSARSLGAQAKLAENERAALAADAETILDEANAAARVAEAKIAKQAAASNRLNGQLMPSPATRPLRSRPTATVSRGKPPRTPPARPWRRTRRRPRRPAAPRRLTRRRLRLLWSRPRSSRRPWSHPRSWRHRWSLRPW